jgi:hypothetical protein
MNGVTGVVAVDRHIPRGLERQDPFRSKRDPNAEDDDSDDKYCEKPDAPTAAAVPSRARIMNGT